MSHRLIYHFLILKVQFTPSEYFRLAVKASKALNIQGRTVTKRRRGLCFQFSLHVCTSSVWHFMSTTSNGTLNSYSTVDAAEQVESPDRSSLYLNNGRVQAQRERALGMKRIHGAALLPAEGRLGRAPGALCTDTVCK